MKFIDELASNSLFTVIVSMTAILGIILTIYYANKSKHSKLIKYDLKTTSVVKNNNKYTGLKLLYNEEVIDNYSITELWFWNNGHDIINHSDISDADRLRVEIISGELLNVQKVYEYKANNLFDLEDYDNKCKVIKFDYMAKNDGCVLQIIHTGISSSSIVLKGEVKGFGNPKLNLKGIKKFTKTTDTISGIINNKLPKILKSIVFNAVRVLGILFSLFTIVIGIAAFFYSELGISVGITFLFMGLVYMILIISSFIKKYPRSLEKYFRK